MLCSLRLKRLIISHPSKRGPPSKPSTIVLQIGFFTYFLIYFKVKNDANGSGTVWVCNSCRHRPPNQRKINDRNIEAINRVVLIKKILEAHIPNENCLFPKWVIKSVYKTRPRRFEPGPLKFTRQHTQIPLRLIKC